MTDETGAGKATACGCGHAHLRGDEGADEGCYECPCRHFRAAGGTNAVQVGDVWQDRDPRSPNEVTVVQTTPQRVWIRRPTRTTVVRTARFVRAFRLIRRIPTPPPGD